MTLDQIREAVAQGWCSPANSHKTMDTDLAIDIADAVFAAQAPAFTTGRCKNKAQPGGCQLHNLQCGYPECDRQAAPMRDIHAEVVASHIQNIRCVKPLECPKCHALWLFWPKEQSGFATDTLSVKSATHCNYCENARADQLVPLDRVQAQAAEPDLNDLLVGKLVSMDVSTGEHDAYHRVFGTVCEVMLQSCGAAEDTILAIEDSRNFQAAVEPVTANNDEVICPNCCNQFRAIPVNVQQLMLDAGFEPPFKKAPAVEPVGYTDKHGHTYAIKWSGALPPNLTLYTSQPDHREAMRLALSAMQPVAAYGRVGSKDTEQAALQAAIAALEKQLEGPTP